jgi:hypothetical protein
LVTAYYLMAVPLATLGVVTLLQLSKSNGWLGYFSPIGIIAIIIAFVEGRRLARNKDQQIAQRARDQRAVQIYDRIRAGEPERQLPSYSLYLRPFTSTARARIPLRSAVLKRSVSEPTMGVFDPELGKTTRYKRHVTFGDFETELAALVEADAPLIALGKTGEQIGAGRIRSDDKDWITSFERLAEHAIVIFLMPSIHEGTQWEIKRIRDDAQLLRKTILYIPPNDTVLGWDAGPHLEIGAGKGPVGKLDLRKEAIEALTRLVPDAPVSRIKKDEWGVLLRLTDHYRVDSYHALRMAKGLSLSPFTVGSNLHIDREHLRDVIQADLHKITRAHGEE